MDIENKDELIGKKEKIIKETISWVKTIVFAFIFAFIITQYIIVNATVPTGSMIDTINEKDRLVANRLAYLFDDPQRGDIVVFIYPDDGKTLYIKRVIGIPGDIVKIEEDGVYVNGEKLDEDYVTGRTFPHNGVTEFKVPDNSYFMLGDNRENSADSRYWKNTYVEKDKILGKAVFKYWPKIEVLK